MQNLHVERSHVKNQRISSHSTQKYENNMTFSRLLIIRMSKLARVLSQLLDNPNKIRVIRTTHVGTRCFCPLCVHKFLGTSAFTVPILEKCYENVIIACQLSAFRATKSYPLVFLKYVTLSAKFVFLRRYLYWSTSDKFLYKKNI